MTHESGNTSETPAGEAGFQSLRRQMEQTRSALAGKLHSLQKRMTNSVDSACDAIDETVRVAKTSALDAVQVIKCTLDLKQQATRHPWTMVGVATCIGALLAKRHRDRTAASGVHDGTMLRQSTDMKQQLGDRIKSELRKLQDEAISIGARMMRDWMETTAQQFKSKSSDTAGK